MSSTRLSRSTRDFIKGHARAVLALLFVALFLPSVVAAPIAGAQVGPSDASCRAAIAKAGGKYIKTAQKVITGCHKLRNAGKIPAALDCNNLATADIKVKIPTAAQKARDAVIGNPDCGAAVLAQFGRCPVPFETIDDGGATTGIDEFTELADCLIAHTDALAQDTAETVLGSPTAPLVPDVQRCHSALAKGYTKLVNTTVKERAKCQSASDKVGGAFAFACATSDPNGKILTARNKAASAITSACTILNPLSRSSRDRGLPDMDSCAETLDGLIVCALDDTAGKTGGGTAAMLWELPGICPGTGSYVVVPVSTGTELDTGFSGLVHDMDPILGYRGAAFTISCDVDCANCVSTAVAPPADACRCNGDPTVVCANDLACTGFGGTCQCFYGPPTPYSAGSSPACVTTRVDGSMSGSLDPATGAVALAIPLRVTIYLGIGVDRPCPLCDAGACDGGSRDGLACTVDATDATFGSVSYDCPPSPGSNITGAGLETTVDYTTGSTSLPFGTDCGGFLTGSACACAVCTGDTSLTCNSDAECAGVGAGTCTAGVTSSTRFPNKCDDLICSPDPGGAPDDGTCFAGPTDSYCDGYLRANGEGILGCADNADCQAYDPICAGSDCGDCTLSKFRECFLDPIVAVGTPGEAIVGVGCIGGSASPAVNSVIGWPGAYRVKQKLAAELFCSDGVTPYQPPGGSNCP